jgi:hypothetical protein
VERRVAATTTTDGCCCCSPDEGCEQYSPWKTKRRSPI